jgi:hypothetical protein
MTTNPPRVQLSDEPLCLAPLIDALRGHLGFDQEKAEYEARSVCARLGLPVLDLKARKA